MKLLNLKKRLEQALLESSKLIEQVEGALARTQVSAYKQQVTTLFQEMFHMFDERFADSLLELQSK